MVEDGFMERHGVELHLGDPAVALDRAARTVTARSGLTVGYDALVLATGSYPFVPPVPGKDAEGCFVYRTIEDVLAIEAYAKARATTGAVVGGGLLGLEAAGALKGLGLDTHVVEFAPRLMPVQVDEGGGAALRRTHRGPGRAPCTRASAPRRSSPATTARVDGHGAVRRFADSPPTWWSSRPASARATSWPATAGCAVGERGGIVVDAPCRTSDPAVYAIGECALASDGRVYGLVAPGYEMAETAAAASPAARRAFTGADLSTKLKLLGVDVAQLRRRARRRRRLPRRASTPTPRAGVYKKLVIGADGTLLGGILVGDAEPYGTLRAVDRHGACRSPPSSWCCRPARAARSRSARPRCRTRRVICSCHNVTKGAIRGADHRARLHRRAGGQEVHQGRYRLRQLRAGAGPAGRRGAGRERRRGRQRPVRALRAHPRRAVRDRARAADHLATAQLLDRARPRRRARRRRLRGLQARRRLDPGLAGAGDRRDGHVLDGEQAALQDTNDHFLANLQRNGTYSVVPRIPGGEITPEKLIVIGEVARDFGLYTKITGGQRIDLFGARVEQLPAIWRRLVDAGFESGHAYGKALRTVKSCVGQTWCRYGVQDSVRMAIDLELRYRGLRSPHKLKSAVSGCARECAEAQCKDFGVIATEQRLEPVRRAATAAAAPRHADLLATDLSTPNAGPHDRPLPDVLHPHRRPAGAHRAVAGAAATAAWSTCGTWSCDDCLGICARAGGADGRARRGLPRRVGRRPSTTRSGWRRFVSFVNAPDTPDPTVRFVPERGQIKPEPVLLALTEGPGDAA